MNAKNPLSEQTFSKPPQSYWIASTPQKDYPILKEDLQVDVAIIGGGMVGVTCAYLLRSQGLSLVLLEANQLLQGTTGHTTAKVTSQHNLIYSKIQTKFGHEMAQQYADANESAIRWIENLIQEKQIACDFSTQPAYVYTQDDTYLQKINDELRAASSLGLPATFVEDIPFPLSIKGALRFDHQAQFHPRKFLLSLVQELSENGVAIYEKSRIINIEGESPYILTSQQGKRITARTVIIASHYPFHNKSALYFTKLSPQRSYIVAAKANAPYPGGMYINAEQPTRSLRVQNTEDGELILIGGENHKTGQGPDTQQHYQALMAFASSLFEVKEFPYRWSTQDCVTLDELPYAGYFTEKTPFLYLATGFNKWGMTNSIASARVITDLIIRGESPWEQVYSPSRQSLAASAKNFIVENLNVAKSFVTGKLTPGSKEKDVKPGEGKIIKTEGQRTGLYRDFENQLHQVNTTCTHMGCELNWNSAEKTWDCPCHGSRFTYKGHIVEGPAVAPLEAQEDVHILEKLLKDDF